MPEGVVVLGMHRSGTSLITRLVTLLGIEICRFDDLLVGGARNPRGHWESISLNQYNDELLEELGGTWFCPPPVREQETSRLLAGHRDEALAAVRDAHPEQPWVWKDPRTCALMPFWAEVLRGRVVYLLVARHPFEVSDSLAARNGCTPLLSMAMWERYTRQAMLGAAGSPTLACTYDGVLADPVAWSEQLAGFLGEVGVPTRGVDRQAVEAFVMSDLRHSSRSWAELEPGPQISPEQVELARAASVATAQHSYAPPPLPGETPRTTELFREVMELKPKQYGLAALPPTLVTPKSELKDGREDASPPVSLVLADGHAAVVKATLAALGEALPAGSEVLVPTAAEDAGSGDGAEHDRAAAGHLTVRTLDAGEDALGEAAALARGAQEATGRLLLLASGHLAGSQPWYEPLEQILTARRVGGVGPAMRFQSQPRALWFGRSFAGGGLAARPLAAWAAEKPVPVPLLPSTFSAYTRRVFAAAGGIDGEFISAAAAVDELSVRLWRMGFRCTVAPAVEASAPAPDAGEARDDAARLHDRLRIATLHLGPDSLRAFLESASEEPGFEQAAARLAASDTERRRASIDAVCARSGDWYLESFPPGLSGPVEVPGRIQGQRPGRVARLRRRLRQR